MNKLFSLLEEEYKKCNNKVFLISTNDEKFDLCHSECFTQSEFINFLKYNLDRWENINSFLNDE